MPAQGTGVSGALGHPDAPVRRRGRPPKAEAGDTKDALLRAALRLFAAHGYEGTSVRAIARAVGLSESVLYAHFSGKREIFDTVLARQGPQGALDVLARMDPAMADTDPPGFVRVLIGRLVDEWSTPPSRQLISLMAHDDLIHHPALENAIDMAVRGLAERFAAWIAAGRIAADAGAPEELAYALIAPVALARVLWLHDGADPARIAAARNRATRHAEFFISAVFRPRPAGP